MWDVFISHAAEDKDAVARPLAEALARTGYEVWFDEAVLGIGDGLSQSIDRGLSQSRFGIVVLSPHFFAKAWPRLWQQPAAGRPSRWRRCPMARWRSAMPTGESTSGTSPPTSCRRRFAARDVA